MAHTIILSALRLLSLSLLVTTCACPSAGSLIRDFGYTELKPPSTLLSPGALVAIISRDPFQAAIICGPEASLGPGLQLVRSATSSGTLKKLNNSSFDMDAGVMSMIHANSRMTSVESITVTLNNATIVEVRDEDVIRGLVFRSAACAAAVRARLRHNYTVTMISSGLQGDVTYAVNWERKIDEKLSKSDQAGVLDELALTLGASSVDTASAEIKSTGLIWGIRDDEYLSALASTELNQNDYQRGTSHIPIAGVATITTPELAIETPGTYVIPKDVPLSDTPADVVSEPPVKSAP